MKKNKFTIIALFIGALAMAQVGINTSTPLGELHIDGKKDTPATGATPAELKDDFIIDTNGNIGLGTNTPKVRVDLRNPNVDNALGVGDTSLTATQAGEGAIRYNSSGYMEYSNGTTWIRILPAEPVKTVVVATKTSRKTAIYAPGGYSASGSCTPANAMSSSNCYINNIPNRTPAYLTDWTTKYTSSGTDGSFNASTGIFTANLPTGETRTFTATFTFATEAIDVAANSNDSNQIEATWLVYDSGGSLINQVKCANTFPSNSGNPVRVGSNCTASVVLSNGQYIRPALWVDMHSGYDTHTHPYDMMLVNGSSVYNNLTIAEN